jgi:hypothetical protein
MADAPTSKNGRPWWQRPGCIFAIVVPILLVVGGIWLYLSVYQGRDISRFTGVPVKLTLPDCVTSNDQVVSVSFHSLPSGETIKDVTYICDGRLFSHEYNDFGILQGSIEWNIKGR